MIWFVVGFLALLIWFEIQDFKDPDVRRNDGRELAEGVGDLLLGVGVYLMIASAILLLYRTL